MINKKLIAGQVFKNYKEIAIWLGVEPAKPTATNVKKSHLKEFERYCKYHKEGQKFIVDEVYDEPLEKEDGRKSNKGSDIRIRNSDMYDTLMDDIVMFSLNEHGIIADSFFKIINDIFGLVTERYNDDCISEFKNSCEERNTDKKGVFLNYSNILKRKVEKQFVSSLKRLEKKGYIYWKEDIMILKNSSIEAELLNSYDKKDEIKQHEKIAYLEMEIKPSQRQNYKLNKKFKKYVLELMEEEDIYNYWNVYIVCQANKFYDYDFKTIDYEFTSKEITKRFIHNIHKSMLEKTMQSDTIGEFKPYGSQYNINQMIFMDRTYWSYYDDDYCRDNDIAKFKLQYAMEKYNSKLQEYNQLDSKEKDDLAWGMAFEVYDFEEENFPF